MCGETEERRKVDYKAKHTIASEALSEKSQFVDGCACSDFNEENDCNIGST